ncbi:MAG: hypothetical protein AAF587_08715 [Bacteroidota bacterium]
MKHLQLPLMSGLIVVFLLMMSSACQLADLRTPHILEDGLSDADAEKGRALLESAWKAQGMDQLRKHKVYSVTLEDHWRGTMGKMSTLWPDQRIHMDIKYAINTFDSQLQFLDGKEKGKIAGLQSWQYYEKTPDGPLSFEVPTNANYRFGLAAFQYFFELADRLKDAPLITYAGQKEALGKTFDLVFVTWDLPEPHEQHDHYRLWIDQKTHRLEVAEYTIRDAPQNVPGSQSFFGSIWFQDFREIDGVWIPFEQYVFVNEPKDNTDKYFHKLTVSQFEFDSFDPKILYPNPEIERLGDDKLIGSE